MFPVVLLAITLAGTAPQQAAAQSEAVPDGTDGELVSHCVAFLQGWQYNGTRVLNRCSFVIHVRYCYEPNRRHDCRYSGGVWDERVVGPTSALQIAWNTTMPYVGFACRLPYRVRQIRTRRGSETQLYCDRIAALPTREHAPRTMPP